MFIFVHAQPYTTTVPSEIADVPRWNFGDNLHAFMIVFRSLCGESIETFFDVILFNGNIIGALCYYIGLVLILGFAVSENNLCAKKKRVANSCMLYAIFVWWNHHHRHT